MRKLNIWEVIEMEETMKHAMDIHKRTTEELIQNRTELFDKLLDMGADPNDLIELMGVSIELSVRDFIKELGL